MHRCAQALRTLVAGGWVAVLGAAQTAQAAEQAITRPSLVAVESLSAVTRSG